MHDLVNSAVTSRICSQEGSRALLVRTRSLVQGRGYLVLLIKRAVNRSTHQLHLHTWSWSAVTCCALHACTVARERGSKSRADPPEGACQPDIGREVDSLPAVLNLQVLDLSMLSRVRRLSQRGGAPAPVHTRRLHLYLGSTRGVNN